MERIYSEGEPPGRSDRDAVLSTVLELASRTRVRVLKGGGSVLAYHGLISPRVSRSVSFIVDPHARHTLVAALRGEGWRLAVPRRHRPLPPARLRLVHDDREYAVHLHSVVPGFFADPARAFATLWIRRDVMVASGDRLDIIDRLATVLFAAHDRLDGRPRARVPGGHFDYFLEQFRASLSAAERSQLLRLTVDLGAHDEFRELLVGLGMNPGEAARPSTAYARERLALHLVRPGDLWLLERFELSALAPTRQVGWTEQLSALRRAASAASRMQAGYDSASV